MKIAALIARILLGLMFLVFGLNKFFNFIPQPPMTGLAGEFVGAIYLSHELRFIAALEVIAALLLLSNFYVPLGLTLLGPIVVNIFLFHAFMEPSGLPIACLTVILWLIVYQSVRSAFAGIFVQKT